MSPPAHPPEGVIRPSAPDELELIGAIINDAAETYRGLIPADCWHEPYMPLQELRDEIAAGVRFSVYEEAGVPTGVMGIQDKGVVTLIRHAYVRTAAQGRGIGTRLLTNLLVDVRMPVLIGTWAAATRSISFYRRHGFRVVPEGRRAELLRRFWSIPTRQLETSLVLADLRWFGMEGVAPPSE